MVPAFSDAFAEESSPEMKPHPATVVSAKVATTANALFGAFIDRFAG